jgi:hypothetical protein
VLQRSTVGAAGDAVGDAGPRVVARPAGASYRSPMLSTATQPRPARRTLYAGLGAAVLGAAALLATISVVNSAADAVAGAAGAVTQDAGRAGAVPLLASIQLPPAPTACSAADLDERAGQATALQQAQAAEQQALGAVGTDAAARLATARDQARAAVARVQQIDATCAPAG